VSGDGAGDPARPGAGVGLALCRAIATAHGGQLRLRSRRHGGASFELTLPLHEAPAGATPTADEGDVPGRSPAFITAREARRADP
jgi:two-component system sensor histidine kinase KdpD